MIDGCIYLVRTAFINEIKDRSDINHEFWNGKFKTVKNPVLFCDIDTKNDLK